MNIKQVEQKGLQQKLCLIINNKVDDLVSEETCMRNLTFKTIKNIKVDDLVKRIKEHDKQR